MKMISEVSVRPEGAFLDGKLVSSAPITGLYREFAGDYPKFFKMDRLCRLGFVAAEIILANFTPEEKENMAIVLFNRNGSLVTDRNYQQTISDGNYFPSPALFVYTLANIVTGEIAIRHKIYGETSFYISDSPDREAMENAAADVYLTAAPSAVLSGWVDFNDEDDYLAEFRLFTN